MVKRGKSAKNRKDKFYRLARETGYRSRAAFKLIQLNRKFGILQKSRVCIDLCASPGGWMQVAQQNMPVSSIIIGVDLYPIKPIPGCISVVEDITTEKCRTTLAKELQSWKADIVLNDGSPNLGKNWLHDAYQQSCLTLSAVKLATQFLRPGGWFITKLFRSKDYNSLMWVFQQFFKKVQATKPAASRSESAEIFVVCEHYIAPAKIDARFFDIKYVFEELETEPKQKLNVFHPERKQKAKAIGYPSNDYTLYHKVSVRDFVLHENGLEVLEKASEIVMDDEEILNHVKTTSEIIECCKDIKVLGRKDLKRLLNWCKELHEEFYPTPKVEDDGSIKSETEEVDELEAIDKQIGEMQDEERKELKKKRKKIVKERQKLNERLNLKMVHKGDEGPVLEGEDTMFSLKQVSSKQQMSHVIDQNPDNVAVSDDEEIKIPAKKYQVYNKEEGHLSSKTLHYQDSESELEMESDDEEDNDKIEGLGLNDSDSEPEEQPSTDKRNEVEHPLYTDLDHRSEEKKLEQKAQLWFERDIFKDLINEEEEDADLDMLVKKLKNKGVAVIGEDNDACDSTKNKTKHKLPEDSAYNSESSSDNDSDSSNSDYEVEKEIEVHQGTGTGADDVEVIKKKKSNSGKHKLTEEELALGTMMINSKKTKRDLIDAAWNRYTFNDKNLPDWFVTDENMHMQRLLPVTKELVQEYKNRLKEINERPIKKVVEAKARKKKRAFRKLEKAKKKIEELMDNVDVGDKEKARQIAQLYKKAKSTRKKEVTYVVSKKFNTGKKARRPAGLKGPYKIVDRRLKKDTRALLRVKDKSKNKVKKARVNKKKTKTK